MGSRSTSSSPVLPEPVHLLNYSPPSIIGDQTLASIAAEPDLTKPIVINDPLRTGELDLTKPSCTEPYSPRTDTTPTFKPSALSFSSQSSESPEQPNPTTEKENSTPTEKLNITPTISSPPLNTSVPKTISNPAPGRLNPAPEPDVRSPGYLRVYASPCYIEAGSWVICNQASFYKCVAELDNV